jgi:cytochrome c oxidase subunit 4
MAAEHHPDLIADPAHEDHHVVSPAQYAIVYIALLLFTGITAGVAFLELGIFNPIVAVGIACLKASIVVLFFMHIKYSSRLVQFTCGAGFFTFLVLVTMCLSDYMSRAWGQW